MPESRRMLRSVVMLLWLSLSLAPSAEPLALRGHPYQSTTTGQGEGMMVSLKELAKAFDLKVNSSNGAFLVDSPADSPASPGQVLVRGRLIESEDALADVFVNLKQFAEAAGLSYRLNEAMSRIEVDRVSKVAAPSLAPTAGEGERPARVLSPAAKDEDRGPDLHETRDEKTGLIGFTKPRYSEKAPLVWVVRPKFQSVGQFRYGLCPVQVPDTHGTKMETVKHEWIIMSTDPEKHGTHETTTSTEAFATTSRGKWGYIDVTGAWVISPRFAHAYTFEKRTDIPLAMVQVGRKTQWIDRTGQVHPSPYNKNEP